MAHDDRRDPKVESTAEGDERGERGIDESGMASARFRVACDVRVGHLRNDHTEELDVS